MTATETPSERQIEHIRLKPDQELVQVAVDYAHNHGLPDILPFGSDGLLFRRFSANRLEIMLATGPDRDETSDISTGQYAHDATVIEQLDLRPHDIIRLQQLFSLGPDDLIDEIVAAYNPRGLEFVPGTVMRVPKPGATFRDALIAVFSYE